MLSEKQKAQRRAYYRANRKKMIDKVKAYYLANKDKIKDQGKIYYSANREKILKEKKAYYLVNRERKKLYMKNYDSNPANKERRSTYDREYWIANRDKRRKQKTEWAKNNRERINAKHRQYIKKWLKIPENQLIVSIRQRINKAVKYQYTLKSARTQELLGCSISELRTHLEKQFKPDMSWENYGKWHIDHRLPLASFDLKKPSEQRKAFHYTNLQPLWAKENLTKHTKIL